MKRLLTLIALVALIAAPAMAGTYNTILSTTYVEDNTTSLNVTPQWVTVTDKTNYCEAHLPGSGSNPQSSIHWYTKSNTGTVDTFGYGNYYRLTAVNWFFAYDYIQCYNGINYNTYSNRYLPLKSINEVNFTGYPLDGHSPLSVSFTIQNFTSLNSNGTTWIFGDGQTTTSTSSTVNYTYQNPGIYIVTMSGTDLAGRYISITKNNYITVGASNATKTKYFQTIDGTNGNIVLNSSIQLQDIENSSWTNATGLSSDGMSSITTPIGHHINAYAQSLGYSDADDLAILNDGQPQYIMMWPTFAKNVSAGNVSLYVTVKDKDTHANIVGAGVTASLASGSMSTTTNEAGIAYFIVKNSSMVLITAQAIGQGYQTATTTINTGSGSGGSASAAATILLGKNTVTPVFSTVVTTLPGGGTPTPVITILPGCEDTISTAGQEKCRAAQSNHSLSWLSNNLFGLIQICFVVTILYLLGIKLGK